MLEKKEISLAKWARDQFAKELRNSGLYSDVSPKSHSYADVEATTIGGIRKYFEIKASSITKEILQERIVKGMKFFDAATITEWKTAIEHPDDYVFEMLYIDQINGERVIIDREEYTPKELLEFSTVPPFKINFNIPYKKREIIKPIEHRSGTVLASSDKDSFSIVQQLISFYKEIGGKLLSPK